MLLDPDPAWAPPRAVLGLLVVAAAAAAGAVAAGAFRVFAQSALPTSDLAAVPFRPAALAALAVAALAVGAWLRFASLERTTVGLFLDHASLIEPTLALRGDLSDFRDAIRPVPSSVPRPFGVVGVIYLEAFRAALHRFGVTVFGVQFLSALAGTVSLVTAGALGRRLLPRGGGALAVLVLAGMRWQLILSQWAFSGLAVTPVLDGAALAMSAARRRGALGWAAAAGVLAGVAAHVYLAAWIGAAALVAWALWPSPTAPSGRNRAAMAAVFTAGLVLAAAPLFLLRASRSVPYFERTSHNNALLEIQRTGSWLPPFAAAADAAVAPWLLGDPIPRQDLPHRSRLGWILGVPVGLALARALLRPRDELSGFLLAQAGAGFAAAVAGGQAHLPHGFRFAYLTTPTAIAAAAGALLLLAAVPASARRPAAIAAVGLFAISGALGARDAILRWPMRRETFVAFEGRDYLIGRSAARWSDFGEVALAPGLGSSDVTIGVVARRRIGEPPAEPRRTRPRAFRVAAPDTPTSPGERRVERVEDPWGRELAVVLGRAGSSV